MPKELAKRDSNPMPTENEKKWIAAWKSAAVELERIHDEELLHVDRQQAAINLSGAFEYCLMHRKPRPSSGLVEMQSYFRRAQR